MPAGDGSRLRLQRRGGGGSRGLQRRHQAEEEGRGQRDAGREQQDPQVGCRRERDVGRVEREEAQERAGQADGQHEPGRAPRAGQDQALEQELFDDLPPPRAERRPDRDLLLAGRRTGQQQVRDVRARDQQHQADQGLQDDQRLLEPRPDVGVAARRRHDPEGLLEEALLVVGELREELALQLFLLSRGVDRLEMRLGLLA
jgi:hypothetical protein